MICSCKLLFYTTLESINFIGEALNSDMHVLTQELAKRMSTHCRLRLSQQSRDFDAILLSTGSAHFDVFVLKLKQKFPHSELYLCAQSYVNIILQSFAKVE